MDIALDGSKHDFPSLFPARDAILRLDSRLEKCHGLLHRTCGFHDLREKHFPRTEKIANLVHSAHERTVDNVHRAGIGLERLGNILLQVIAVTFN